MEVSSILLRQLFTMFLYMALGYLLFKIRIISKQGSRELGSLLLYAIMPCVILRSFAVGFSTARLQALGISFLLSLAALLLSILVSGLIFKKKPIDNFGSSYSNAGYMGIPLVNAVLGEEGVFYIVAFVALLNILQWTHGALTITGDRSCISPKKIFTNPLILAVFLGFGLFLAPFEIPPLLDTAIATVGNMNSPVAMIILGCYLAQTPLLSVVADKSLYFTSLMRLVAIPLLTLVGLALLPAIPVSLKLAVLIVASAPIGSNVAIFAHMFGQDYTRAVRLVCLSTILSLASMPLVIALGNWIF